MKTSVFMIVKAVISLGFGLCYIIIPGITAPWFGIQLDAYGILMARWLGAFLCGVGLICLFTGTSEESKLKQGILLSLFLTDIAGFVIALVGQLSGWMNALGWVIVAIWILLALGLGYLRFLRKAPTQ